MFAFKISNGKIFSILPPPLIGLRNHRIDPVKVTATFSPLVGVFPPRVFDRQTSSDWRGLSNWLSFHGIFADR
ncbi:MAG: hypothetical protein IBX69_09165 [Anaerolineales bacterium]|nr:hypothetical protein [Anaerolineales bacterium]